MDGEGGPIDWSTPACAALAEQTKPTAEWHLKRYAAAVTEEKDADEIHTLLGDLGYQYGTLLATGCVEGHEGKIKDVYEAFAYVSTASQRARADRAGEERCIEAFDRVDDMADAARLDSMAGNEAYLTQQIKVVLDWYYGALVASRCVDEL